MLLQRESSKGLWAMSEQPKRMERWAIEYEDGEVSTAPTLEQAQKWSTGETCKTCHLVELREGESIIGPEERAVIEAAKATKCRCRGTGKYEGDCRFCGDSTFDHECVYRVYDCTDRLCSAVRALRELEKSQ